MKYGSLTIIREYSDAKGRRAHIIAECLCDCGKVRHVRKSELKYRMRVGGSVSCGCLRRGNTKVGDRYGKLLVVKESDEKAKRKGVATFECLCDCGTTKYVAGINLRSGTTVSCGCYQKSLARNQFIGKQSYNRKDFGEGALNKLYCSYQAGARTRGYAFTLSKDEFKDLIDANCYYCSKEPSQVAKLPHGYGFYTYNGIDRVDNGIGYVPQNCVPCCKQCNYAKRTFTTTEFIDWVSKVYEVISARKR